VCDGTLAKAAMEMPDDVRHKWLNAMTQLESKLARARRVITTTHQLILQQRETGQDPVTAYIIEDDLSIVLHKGDLTDGAHPQN
jgi:hypothetical protein